jgi:hypothetical protein
MTIRYLTMLVWMFGMAMTYAQEQQPPTFGSDEGSLIPYAGDGVALTDKYRPRNSSLMMRFVQLTASDHMETAARSSAPKLQLANVQTTLPQEATCGDSITKSAQDPLLLLGGRVQFDFMGDLHFSRYNFTDLLKPYNGVDTYVVAKLGLWADKPRTLGLFAQSIPVWSSRDSFFFQRYLQGEVGVQWYPIDTLFNLQQKHPSQYLRALRLFGQISGREYYDAHPGATLIRDDVQVGLDYYWDNLFERDQVGLFLYTNAAYHTTNFSLRDYKGLVWSGNVKIGPKHVSDPMALIPYVVADWTYSPQHDDRFFENFLRVGCGLRWYPMAYSHSNLSDLALRFNVYAEVFRNAAWLGIRAPSSVEETDFRFGISFSTGGFFKK